MAFFNGCILLLTLTVEFIDAALMSEYSYALQRDQLFQKEKKFEGKTINLTPDEIVVDNYMEYLKWVEFERTRDAFPPSRPIEQVLDTIKEAEIYSTLKKFPKGGNIHLHSNQVLSKKKMLDKIFDSEMLQFLCVESSNDVVWSLNFYNTPPAGWEKVTDNPTKYTKEALYKHVNFLDALSDTAKSYPTDSSIRWSEMIPVFGAAGSDIILFENYTSWHIRALFQAAKDENVQYLEIRSSQRNIYNLDDSQPGGHANLGDSDSDLWYNMVRETLTDFQADNPDFIGYREIIQGKRFLNADHVKSELERTLRIKQKHPDIIGGFDLVGDEDQGYSLLFFIDEFDENFQESKLPLFFHAAETKWPNDLITSMHPEDPVSALDNAYEAIILGSKRVGDAFGFDKHPYLMQVMKEKNIAVEANPVSNMLLGYVTDQRNHPAITFMRYGIPIVLGADDPGSFGYDEFTVDWYLAYMAWGLNLADLKQLAINSLQYSTMAQAEKTAALQKWEQSWNTFVSNTKTEACSANFSLPSPELYRIYPADGPAMISTNVRVFGRQFQSAICQTIKCKFGSYETEGRYVYNHMITCPTPANQNSGAVPFSISFDSGTNFISTDLTFTYGSVDPMPIPELL